MVSAEIPSFTDKNRGFMQITYNKKTGRIRLNTGKFKYHHKISLGEIIAILVDICILLAIFMVG